MDIPFPPLPELTDNIAYISAAVSIVVGLMLVGWGRLWSRPLMGVIGAGAGFLCGDPLAARMNVDLGVARAAMASIAGVLGFVAAPLFWAMLAGTLCASVAGGFLAENFLAEVGLSVEPPAGGFTTESWAEWLSVFSRDVSSEMWQERASTMVMIMAPIGLIPMLLGFWQQRFITIVMTSLVGAIAVVGGAGLAIVQSDPTHWPKAWSGTLIPLCIAGGLWLCGVAMQYSFVLAAARKKKAKEAAQAQSDGDSGGRR